MEILDLKGDNALKAKKREWKQIQGDVCGGIKKKLQCNK